MRFDDATPGRLVLRDGDTVLAEYVYEPSDVQLESPRPYALLNTRVGTAVTAYRPDDHVWHKGLSLALPNVGPHNFWGGPTYVDGEGYVQRPNNGAQVHRGFHASDTPVADEVAQLARVDERLDWVTEAGETILTEERTLTAALIDDATWALTWSSRLTNISAESLSFGSPTSRGRPDAGYAGIFWRGPSSFTGGDILTPDGPAGDAARGSASEWLAFISPDRTIGVVMLDAGPHASPWFARSADYAGLCPAPFFYDETVVEPGGTLRLGAVILVGGADAGSHAATVGANLVAAVRADPPRAGDTASTEPEASA
ncbi:MAG TPA: PmoA family protein [Microbacterium sp.]|nr:PmoA family protein [Microbacterium sp.]